MADQCVTCVTMCDLHCCRSYAIAAAQLLCQTCQIMPECSFAIHVQKQQLAVGHSSPEFANLVGQVGLRKVGHFRVALGTCHQLTLRESHPIGHSCPEWPNGFSKVSSQSAPAPEAHLHAYIEGEPSSWPFRPGMAKWVFQIFQSVGPGGTLTHIH